MAIQHLLEIYGTIPRSKNQERSPPLATFLPLAIIIITIFIYGSLFLFGLWEVQRSPSSNTNNKPAKAKVDNK